MISSGAERRTDGSQLKISGAKQSLAPVLLMRNNHQMTEIQKTDWIYNQARIVEENQRKDFLDSLSGRKNNHTELMPGNILEWCNQIDSGEIYFETEEYEYYEEGAWESDWRTEYHDVFGIIPFLGEAINTCYQLLWQKEYDTTFQLLDRIFRLTFHTDCKFAEII